MNRTCTATMALLYICLWRPSGAATAKEPPGPFSFKSSEHWNRHDSQGAMGRSFESTVTATLLPKGKIRLEDRGTDQHLDLSQIYYKEENTQWRSTWVGSWKLSAKSLVLNLKLSERQCEISVTYRGQPTTKSKCPAANKANKAHKAVRLACAASELKVGPKFTSEDAAKQTYGVWLCQRPSTDRDTTLGGTPLPWIFGKTHCIETTSGGGQSLYQLCPESKP